MRRFLILALFISASACAVQAQVVNTTVCDILKNPVAFNGKMVSIKGTVSAGFDQFIVRGPNCGQRVNAIWLAYPAGTKGKAGPDAFVRLQPARNFKGTYAVPKGAPVKLDKNKEFKRFDSLLSQEHNKSGDMCLGCRRYEVSATLVGRLDGVASAELTRNSSGQIVGLGGFGNMNAYPARLVLQSVSDVTPKAIDYSKSDALAKGGQGGSSGVGSVSNPVVAAQKVADEIGNTQAGIQARKDAALFGQTGAHSNGVSISYSPVDDALPNTAERGTHDSPDGVLFNCTFNMNHLQGNALVVALLHMGQHISELRDPSPNDAHAPAYILESDAWAVSISAAMVTRQKLVTLTGGYTIWDAKWPSTDIGPNFSKAINAYLTKEALLSR